MPTISTKSLPQIRLSWIAAAQGVASRISRVLDFSEGSAFLAIAEAAGTIGLWLQKLALQVLETTRFATSMGADADTWGDQFRFYRLKAVPSNGTLTFSRVNTAFAAVIPINQVVQLADGSQSFIVYTDTNNPRYSSSVGGYLMPIGLGTVNVPARAAVAGSAGNVQANSITLIVGSLPFIDSVNNPAAFLNGLDKEPDPAFKARFPAYLAGLASSDEAAITAAVQSVQQGIQFQLIKNQIVVGNPPVLTDLPGMFIVVVDDGSGAPDASLLQQVKRAVEAVRAFTVECQVRGPYVVPVTVVFTLQVAAGYDLTTLEGQSITVVTRFLNTRPLGLTILPTTKISQVIYDAVAGVTAVDGVTLNGLTNDLLLSKVMVVKAGAVVPG